MTEPKPSSPETYIITVDESRPIAEIATELRRAGFITEQTLEAIGTITGKAESSALSKLRRIAGVIDVSKDHPIDLGPPSGDTTW